MSAGSGPGSPSRMPSRQWRRSEMLRFVSTSTPFPNAVEDEAGDEIRVGLLIARRVLCQTIEDDCGAPFDDEESEFVRVCAADLAAVHCFCEYVSQLLGAAAVLRLAMLLDRKSVV